MKFDVYADLDHLYMLNFSVAAGKLQRLVPEPLRVLERRGRGFPSVVLPSIRNLRPVRLGFPRVNYELCGLRVLVEHDSAQLGKTKGIYFADLIMDPAWVCRIANSVSPFRFAPGTIVKKARGPNGAAIDVEDGKGAAVLSAKVAVPGGRPSALTPNSCFESAEEALNLYNDIAYGFLAEPGSRKIDVLQIADPHPNYNAWPLNHLEVTEVHVARLHDHPALAGGGLTLEPSYFVGPLPRYWRWLKSERVEEWPAGALAPAG